MSLDDLIEAADELARKTEQDFTGHLMQCDQCSDDNLPLCGYGLKYFSVLDSARVKRWNLRMERKAETR